MYRYIKSSNEDKFADFTVRRRRNYAKKESGISEEDLWALAKDEDEQVKLNVIWNDNVTPEILVYLADDPDIYIRNRVAWRCHTDQMEDNKKLTEEVTRRLIAHLKGNCNNEIEDIVRLKHVPADVLDWCARHYSPDISYWTLYDIIENPKTLPETLEYLYNMAAELLNRGWFRNEEATKMKYRIAKNPNTPTWILMLLSGDNDPKISDAANKTLS